MKIFIYVACIALGAAAQDAKETLFKANKAFRLNCDVKLDNVEKYEWLKDDKPVITSSKMSVLSDGSLEVQNPDSTAEGTYQCTAKTAAGVASSDIIRAKMMFITVPKVELKKHSPVKGEPLAFYCPKVEAYPKPTIAWLKQTESGNTENVLTFRTTIGPNGFLYFVNVTDEDVSKDLTYVCSASHPALEKPATLAEHAIEDLKPNNNVGLKKAVPLYISDNVLATEGDSIFLYCIYGGAIPPPDYFFEGKNVNGDENPKSQRVTRHNRSKGKRLHIKEVWMTDAGTYTCRINEADGTTTTQEMRLTVANAPAFVKKAEPKTNAKRGEEIIIPCQVKGFLASEVTWTYNAKPLAAGDRISFASSESSGVVTKDLKIKGIQKSDAGYYGCKAISGKAQVYSESLLAVF